jgi:hypothetical protein
MGLFFESKMMDSTNVGNNQLLLVGGWFGSNGKLECWQIVTISLGAQLSKVQMSSKASDETQIHARHVG